MYLQPRVPSPRNDEGGACTTPELITSLMATGVALQPPDQCLESYCSVPMHHDLLPPPLYCAADPYTACDPPPPSVQATRTHLIKESLKVTIQCKRLASGQCLSLSAADARSCFAKEEDELTPEDEERRRRRRERNKVAATKCRNKKKERTVTLLMESDTLEQTNMSLRTEIQRLELEKQRLLDMLHYHIPACSLQVPGPCSLVGM